MLLLAGMAALAAGGPGEALVWSVRVAGINAGQAGTRSLEGPGHHITIETWLKNADWYAPIYTVDDSTRSTWSPQGGSVRYETRFREGGFQQDQDMRLDPAGFEVWRRQKGKEGWREWTTPYAAAPYVEDPVTVIFALRESSGEGPWSMPVFSGKNTWPLNAELIRRETLEGTALGNVDVRVIALQTRHRGEWEQQGRFLVYLTDDAERIPIRMVIRSSIGAIRVDLIAYTPPQTGIGN